MFSKQAIDEFKLIMKEDYGEELSDGEATEMGERLVRFFDILLRIDRRENAGKNKSSSSG